MRPWPTGEGDWKAATEKGLVGGGELVRLAKGPAWVSEKVARLSHKAERMELESFMIDFE